MAASHGGFKAPVVGVDAKETVDRSSIDVTDCVMEPELVPIVTVETFKLITVVAIGHVSGGGRESVSRRDSCAVGDNAKTG